MNRRHLALFLLLAGAATLFQWWQRTQILDAETSLRAELARLKEQKAQMPAPAARTAASAADSPQQPQGATFDPDKLVADFIALVPLIRDARNKAPASPASTGDLEQRAMAIMGQITTAPPALLKQAYENLMSSALPTDIKNETSQPLLLRLAETDPAWAIAQSVKIVDHPHILRSIIKVWATQDAAAATAWIESSMKDGSLAGYETGSVRYEAGGIVKALRYDVAAARASADPIGALDGLIGLSHEEQRQSVSSMASALKTADQRRSALERIAGGDQAEDQKILTFQNFAKALGEYAGFEASRAALDAAKLSPRMRDAAAASIAATGIGPETAARANWLLENRRSDDPEPFSTFIRTWTKADFNGAANWMKTQPAGPQRDTAIVAFATEVASTEPPSAVDWASTITDPAQRTTTLRQLWKTWHAKAPDEAAAYFQKHGLTVPE